MADQKYGDIRAFLEAVAAEFRTLHPSPQTVVVLEPTDAGDSFEHDLVRVKFRTRRRNEVNAGGLIVTADAEADLPKNVAPADVARLLSAKLAAVDVVQSIGRVSTVEYTTVTLDALLRARA